MKDNTSRADLFLAQELNIGDRAAAQAQLQDLRLVLVLASEGATDRLAQLAYITAANILCRLGPYCPNIDLHAPQGVKVCVGMPLLESGVPLVGALCKFMESTQDPSERPSRRYGSFAAETTYDIVLTIGGQAGVDAHQSLFAWYERWTGGVARAPRRVSYRGVNPFGALLAGALGATAVSRLLLARVAHPASTPQALPDAFSLSAYSYQSPTQPELEQDISDSVDLRPLAPLLLVGSGAVASGLALGLASLQNLVGALEVADDDVLDETNLERHLISSWSHIGEWKAQRLASFLASTNGNGLQVQAHTSLYEALPETHWRIAITAVDSPGARRRIQFDLPAVLLNAGTVGPEFLVSRHDYGGGPCSECLYPEREAAVRSSAEIVAVQTGLDIAEVEGLLTTRTPLTDEQIERARKIGSMIFSPEDVSRAGREGLQALVDAACTTAKVRPGLPVATIGFVAALPGILLAAELVKEAMASTSAGERPVLAGGINVLRLDTFGSMEPELERSRPSRGCRCQTDLMRATYNRIWGAQQTSIRGPLLVL